MTRDTCCILACIYTSISIDVNNKVNKKRINHTGKENGNRYWYIASIHFSHVSKITVSNPTRAPEQVGPDVFRRPSGIVVYNSTKYARGKKRFIYYTGFRLA